MGLFDFLTSAKTAPTPGSEGAAAQPGLMGKLNYGGVPFGLRIMAAAEALRTIEHPDMSRPSLALLAKAKEQSDADKKDAEERAKKQEKANRLADKIELSNPDLAEALRADPELVDEYGKGVIGDMYYKRNRGDAIEDRNYGADVQREGWGVADARQEDSQAHDLTMESERAKNDLEKEAKKSQLEIDRDTAKAERDKLLAAGRVEQAKMLADSFFEVNGVPLDDPGASPAVPPSAVPTPLPGSLDGTPLPKMSVPGLTKPPAIGVPDPGMPATGGAPPEEGDTATSSQATRIWSQKFSDPDLTDTEAVIMTNAFKEALSESAVAGKDPDVNLALGAATEAYREILKTRAEQGKATAAQQEADTKANEGDVKARLERSAAADTVIKRAQNRVEHGRVILDAVGMIEKAKQLEASGDTEGLSSIVGFLENQLPATGFGSSLVARIGETNARVVWNAAETIKSKIGFEELQKMREESPTGGALGQVAVQELEMLQKAMGALDQTDPTNFEAALNRVVEHYSKVVETQQNYAQDISNLRNNPSPDMIKGFNELYGNDAHLRFVGE